MTATNFLDVVSSSPFGSPSYSLSFSKCSFWCYLGPPSISHSGYSSCPLSSHVMHSLCYVFHRCLRSYDLISGACQSLQWFKKKDCSSSGTHYRTSWKYKELIFPFLYTFPAIYLSIKLWFFWWNYKVVPRNGRDWIENGPLLATRSYGLLDLRYCVLSMLHQTTDLGLHKLPVYLKKIHIA